VATGITSEGFFRRAGLLPIAIALISAAPFCLAVLPSAPPPMKSEEGFFSLNVPVKSEGTAFLRELNSMEREFIKWTGYPASEHLPVVVALHDPSENAGSPPTIRVDVTDGGAAKIQVDLVRGSESSRQVQRLLAEALLLREFYGERAPRPGSRIDRIPPWIAHGLGRLCSPKAPPVTIPAKYIGGKKPPTIREFTGQREPEEQSETLGLIYDATASILLEAGLKAGGEGPLREWIGKNGSLPSGARPAFPPGWPESAVERRWLLRMPVASTEASERNFLLGFDETVSRYHAIMESVNTPDHSLLLLRKEKGGAYLVTLISQRLGALRLEANPLSLPLIDTTLALCQVLRKPPGKKAEEEQKAVALIRLEMNRRARGITDYLDWYEAAKIPVSSGLFDALLATPETPVQKGPVGRYLDAVEARGW